MKTINKLLLVVGIVCSMSVWADSASEKATLETYFSSRGTNYQDVIALAEANQELRDSVNNLYKNSYAIIDTLNGEYIFQGVFTVDGQAPTDMPKKSGLFFTADSAAYLGTKACEQMQYVFQKELPKWMDECAKCSGKDAPKRLIAYIQPEDSLFSELPFRLNGIQYAINGGLAYIAQRKLDNVSPDFIDQAKCILNSDVYFKSLARMIETFQISEIYKKASAKPLIYDEPLAKAKRLKFLNLKRVQFTLSKDIDTIYTATEHTASISMVDPAAGATIEYSLDKGATWTAGTKYSRVDIGTDSVIFRIKHEDYHDSITAPVVLKVNYRSLTPITFKIVDTTRIYTGDILSTYATYQGTFYGNDDFVFVPDTAGITEVGSVIVNFTSVQIIDQEGKDVTKGYILKGLESGTMTIYNIHPEATAMYDQWNIVLNVNAFQDTLKKQGVNATILPQNVTWYRVNQQVDVLDPITGTVSDDVMATPFSGLYHTEGEAMEGEFYASVYVPEAAAVLGVTYFQSLVVFMNLDMAIYGSRGINKNDNNNTRKVMSNGQLIIIRDGKQYNAQGQEL